MRERCCSTAFTGLLHQSVAEWTAICLGFPSGQQPTEHTGCCQQSTLLPTCHKALLCHADGVPPSRALQPRGGACCTGACAAGKGRSPCRGWCQRDGNILVLPEHTLYKQRLAGTRNRVEHLRKTGVQTHMLPQADVRRHRHSGRRWALPAPSLAAPAGAMEEQQAGLTARSEMDSECSAQWRLSGREAFKNTVVPSRNAACNRLYSQSRRRHRPAGPPAPS